MRTRDENIPKDALRLKERWFECGNEVMRPLRYMINDTYPVSKRDPNGPKYDPVIKEEYDKANKRAQFLLYEQRNIVQNKWLPRYDIIHAAGAKLSEDWYELRSLLIENCLDRLGELLIANAPVLVAQKYVEGVQAAIINQVDNEKRNLTEYMKSFFVKRKSGMPTIAEDFA